MLQYVGTKLLILKVLAAACCFSRARFPSFFRAPFWEQALHNLIGSQLGIRFSQFRDE
jgi:hypothetical protein